MISIEDFRIVRELLKKVTASTRQQRAIMNLCGALEAYLDPTLPKPYPPGLGRFESMTGIEKVRDMKAVFSSCNETFLGQFDVMQLVQIRRMWLASEWDFFPDRWTERQIAEALAGRPPTWDENESPTY